MKTYSAKAADIKREWHVIDASGRTLGRLATEIATLLLGKHKPMYTPNQDTGDNVVVINAGKVKVTGDKARQKIYYRYTGYPGGLRSLALEEMLEKHPERVIEHAVKGMLPHNRLGTRMLKKLRIYTGDTHPHLAQTGTTAEKEQG